MESLDSFMERLASPSPAPGGGAASAMVAIVGAALISMVSGLTIDKKGYEDSKKIMEHVKTRAAEINEELRQLMELDEDAFNKIVEAWKLPKGSEQEKKTRKEQIEKAAKLAIKVPWRIAAISQEILRLSSLLISKGNKNAVTDAGCSLEFSYAALRGVIQNIKINLKSISNVEFVDSEKLKLKLFLEDSEETYRNSLKELDTIL